MTFFHSPSTFKIIALGLSCYFLFSSAFTPFPFDEHHYRIETESELLIEGSSNVNQFTCDCSCERDFTQSSLDMNRHPESNRITFANARLKLTTTNLDCGHKIMNKDLYETLQAKEYPFIYITLLQVDVPPQNRFVSMNQWVKLDANTRITLAGRERQVNIPSKGQKIDDGRYHFTGAVTLKMTDFGLQPPEAMLGLIKVNDEITIHLNLVVRILEA